MSPKEYAFLNTEEIYQHFGITADGLNQNQVDEMKEKYGTNQFQEHKQDTLTNRLIRSFINPFNVILFVLGMISWFTDEFMASNFSRNATTPIIIFSMIGLSGLIRLIQELKSKNVADQMNRLLQENVTVKRDGKIRTIAVTDLVVGDRIYLQAGDRIPADIRIVQSSDFFVSQAALTGESSIIEKNEHVCTNTKENDLHYNNIVYMATTAISGQAQGIVLKVGSDTVYAHHANVPIVKKDAFEIGSNSIARVMLRFMMVLIPIVLVLLLLTGGQLIESFTFALSIAVGLMPEMLPMVISACLAKGSFTMGRKKTIVKDINAMQGFGCMDVLCMDKTGTLTNESILLEYYMDILGNESLDVFDLAFINSYYHSGVGNPIDNALLACQSMDATKLHCQDLLQKYHKLDDIPFDYDRKFVSILVQNKDEHVLITKGDVERVVSRCKYISYQGQVLPMSTDAKQSVSAVVDDMSQDGMKVIALAKKPMNNQVNITTSDESDMILMGYLAFFDAPKASSKESIAALKRLHVVPKVLTGDQANVAVSVCRRVGISNQTVVVGDELDQMDDDQLSNVIKHCHVFAQLRPAQKARIVSLLRKQNHTVGFLGDGINDIPALLQADVGISVDTAVDAARDAADVVLIEKDLNILEQCILEGRKTFTNMLKYIKITASSNFGNILSIVCASAFLPFFPITSIQLLLLNLLYDTLCIVLPWDAVDKADISKPKDWSGNTLGRFMLSFGPISSIFDILTFLFLYFVLCPMFTHGALYSALTNPLLKLQYIAIFQTGWFLESMWSQVLIIHFLRTRKVPFLQSRPSLPVICITLLGIIVLSAMTFTSVADLFGLTTLPWMYFIFLIVVVLLYMICTSIVKSLYQKRYKELI